MSLINKNSSDLAQQEILQDITIVINILRWNPVLLSGARQKSPAS